MVQFSISYYFQSEKFLRSINLVYEKYPRKGGGEGLKINMQINLTIVVTCRLNM